MTTESRTSDEPNRLDPFDFWRKVYEANEQAWTKAMKEVMTSQGYAETQGKMLETFLVFQKMMRDAMSAQLNSLNIPTRDDVSRLGELILSLEEKMDQLDDHVSGIPEIEEMLGEMDARLAAIAGIDLASVAGMDQKLNQLSRQIAGLEEWLARQSRGEEKGSQPQAGTEAAAKTPRAAGGRARPTAETEGPSATEKSK